ncbi:MAG: kelch repeat-containing protein, partial [Proteobacteria bacterium]|nr:kelch repeat-containing protein [Pseudomonadota bacterium]
MSTARAYHTATLLQNGTVLVTGGTDVNGKALASAEIFDPFNDRFTPTGDMVSARTYHSATLLQDGRVFLDGGDETGTKELFDPSSKTFTPIGTATGKTAGLNAALRNDGVVVVRGPAITVCQPSTGCATGGAAIV